MYIYLKKYHGNGDAIRIGREIQCLRYARFILKKFLGQSKRVYIYLGPALNECLYFYSAFSSSSPFRPNSFSFPPSFSPPYHSRLR